MDTQTSETDLHDGSAERDHRKQVIEQRRRDRVSAGSGVARLASREARRVGLDDARRAAVVMGIVERDAAARVRHGVVHERHVLLESAHARGEERQPMGTTLLTHTGNSRHGALWTSRAHSLSSLEVL